jgi:hypothetical protein
MEQAHPTIGMQSLLVQQAQMWHTALTLHELFTMLHQIIAPLFVCTVPLLAFHTLPAVAQVTQQRAEAGGADRCL